MIFEDSRYFSKRARQSRLARDTAKSRGARCIHADLAARYQRLADSRAPGRWTEADYLANLTDGDLL